MANGFLILVLLSLTACSTAATDEPPRPACSSPVDLSDCHQSGTYVDDDPPIELEETDENE